ncbi:unnamed protein product [Lampetra planeri]
MCELERRFGAYDEEDAQTALEARRRQPGEDLRDYAEDVRMLTQLAYPEYEAKIIEGLAAGKIQRYLAHTSWWQPNVDGTRLSFNTLVERARKCEKLSGERAQPRGRGRECAVASLLSDEEEEIAIAVPATTPTETVTPGDWLRELVAGITGATSLVEGEVNGVRTRILLDTGAVASLVSAAHCSAIGVDVRHLQAPDRALHTASGAGMGLLGRATLEVRIGSQVCSQEFYVSSALCHECIAGTDLLERLGLNVQPRQRCATMESNGERIPFLG